MEKWCFNPLIQKNFSSPTFDTPNVVIHTKEYSMSVISGQAEKISEK
jgi:hypothetical protein